MASGSVICGSHCSSLMTSSLISLSDFTYSPSLGSVPRFRRAARGHITRLASVGLAVDHQRVRVLAVDEPGFGGGHLAVGGQPGGLAVCRPDVDRAGPPGAVEPGAAERAGPRRGDQAR